MAVECKRWMWEQGVGWQGGVAVALSWLTPATNVGFKFLRGGGGREGVDL